MQSCRVDIHFLDEVKVDPDRTSHQQRLHIVGGSQCIAKANGLVIHIVRVGIRGCSLDTVVNVLLHELLHVCYAEETFYLFKPEIKSELRALARQHNMEADLWRKASQYRLEYQDEEFYIRAVVALIKKRSLPFPRFALLITFLRKYLRGSLKRNPTKKGKLYIHAALDRLSSVNERGEMK